MAQPGGQRADALNQYFSDDHGFIAEKQIQGLIIYRRVNGQDVNERIAVKHAQFGDGDEIRDEELLLRRLWGAEHIIRLLSITQNQQHRGSGWLEPVNRPRQLPPPLLPWKLIVDRRRHADARGFLFFATEYLPRDTGDALIDRCRAMNIDEISEPLLWYFFLCRKKSCNYALYYAHWTLIRNIVARACVAMAYPPNIAGADPPAVWREVVPLARRPSRMIHGDLHLSNIMFGDDEVYNNLQPDCHQISPIDIIVKIIDFEMAHFNSTPYDAQRENIRWIGEIMLSLAILDTIPWVDDGERASFRVSVPGRPDFETFATERFINATNVSDDYKRLVYRCMAVGMGNRPNVSTLVRECERNVQATPNWMHLADEVSELFDSASAVVNNRDDDGDPDYVPDGDSDSDVSMGG
ncbi:hypothetical protein F5Y10DRAFT_273543 [Nemania abortiva]|nr:hypothetical protein F5Y10DRAFT_273543 [Nemania abortiva]